MVNSDFLILPVAQPTSSFLSLEVYPLCSLARSPWIKLFPGFFWSRHWPCASTTGRIKPLSLQSWVGNVSGHGVTSLVEYIWCHSWYIYDIISGVSGNVSLATLVSNTSNYVFCYVGLVCWTKYPKIMFTAWKLCMLGPQDCTFKHLLEPQPFPEGGIKMYQ